jgi:hypothetical protein
MKAERPSGKISDVFNFLKKGNRAPLSIEEIGRLTSRGWAGKR